MKDQEQIHAEILLNTIAFYAPDPKGRRSITPNNTCRYRFGERKCAVGRYIPDDRYKPEIDDRVMPVNYALAWCGLEGPMGVDPDFWVQLQRLHDRNFLWLGKGLSDAGVANVKRLDHVFCGGRLQRALGEIK